MVACWHFRMKYSFSLIVLCTQLNYQRLTRINTTSVVSLSGGIIMALCIYILRIQASSNTDILNRQQSTISSSLAITFYRAKAKRTCICFIILLSPPCGSFQEAWQADGFPANFHEIQTQQAEAEAEGHPEGAGLRLRPGRTPSQLWTRWYRDTQASNMTFNIAQIVIFRLVCWIF